MITTPVAGSPARRAPRWQRVHGRQSGVALAIVVWFIAGMSVLVAGIVAHARVDTRMAQLHVARAKAAAAGDGAIQLTMAAVATGRVKASPDGGLPGGTLRIGELDVQVELVPAAGLIDLNSAPPQLLVALFVTAAQLDPGQAKTVADNVVKWRSSSAPAQGRAARPAARPIGPAKKFAAIEDLLRVEGVSRTLLDAVRDYVVAGMPSQRGTNWILSPDAVLAVLQRANPQKAGAVLQQRQRARAAVGSGEGVGAGKGRPTARGSMRLDAIVRYGDQRWLRRRWVSMESGAALSMLPWRMVRTEPPRVIQG